MANLEVIYKKSYLRGKKAYTGSFPVTVVGPLGCKTSEQLAEEREYRQHILSEEPDELADLGYGFTSIDKRYSLVALDGSVLVPFERPNILKPLIVFSFLPSGNFTSTQTLTTSAVGLGSLSYQWYKNQEIIINATNPTLEVASNGSYFCEIRNSVGTARSSSSDLTFKPQMTATKLDSKNYTSTLTLSANSIGVGTISYQWFLNERAIPNETTATYSTSTNGTYYCVIKNEIDSIESGDFTITFKPESTISPSSVIDIVSTPYVASVQASGVGDLTYQWFKDSSVIQGATSTSLNITQDGIYQCLVTNLNGSTNSNQLSAIFKNLTVSTPSFNSSTKVLSVVANGVGTLTYQWKLNGVNVNNSNSSSITATNSGLYTVVVTDLYPRSVTSSGIQVTV